MLTTGHENKWKETPTQMWDSYTAVYCVETSTADTEAKPTNTAE